MKIIKVTHNEFNSLMSFASECFDNIESKTKLSKNEREIKRISLNKIRLDVGKGVLTLNESLKIVLKEQSETLQNRLF